MSQLTFTGQQRTVLCKRGSNCKCPEVVYEDGIIWVGEDGFGWTAMSVDSFKEFVDRAKAGEFTFGEVPEHAHP